METEAFKDMGKEKLGYASSIDVFGTGSKDYPLCKAVVDHDHQGIMAGRWGKIGDEVNRELLEWEAVVGMWDDGSPCSAGKWHSQRQRQ